MYNERRVCCIVLQVVSLLKDRKAAADMDDAFWSAVAEALKKPLAARYQVNFTMCCVVEAEGEKSLA
jgi:ribosomal protein L18E